MPGIRKQYVKVERVKVHMWSQKNTHTVWYDALHAYTSAVVLVVLKHI